MVNFKKCGLFLLSVLLILAVVGCDKKENLDIPSLSESYNGKKVVYADKIVNKYFDYPNMQIFRFACIKEVMDEHAGEDVYFAVGVVVSNISDDYVSNFLYKGKTLQDYVDADKAANKYRQEVKALNDRFRSIVKDIHGHTHAVSEIEVEKFAEYGDITYEFDNESFTVRNEVIQRFSVDGVFKIDLLAEFYGDESAKEVIKTMEDLSKYRYEKVIAGEKKHSSYFKEQGFPTTTVELDYNFLTVIYVQNYKQLEDFKPYKDFKYTFSMMGKVDSDYGFYWD